MGTSKLVIYCSLETGLRHVLFSLLSLSLSVSFCLSLFFLFVYPIFLIFSSFFLLDPFYLPLYIFLFLFSFFFSYISFFLFFFAFIRLSRFCNIAKCKKWSKDIQLICSSSKIYWTIDWIECRQLFKWFHLWDTFWLPFMDFVSVYI